MPRKNNIINGQDPDEEVDFYLPTPDRAARKQMLKDFEAIKHDGKMQKVTGYLQYLTQLKELDEKMDQLSSLDAWGLPKPLTAEDKEALERQMKETAIAGEIFLKNAKAAAEKDESIKMDKGVPGMVGRLQGMLSHDHEAMQAYDPVKKQLSLPEIMENTRTKTIMLGNRQIKALGGAQSSRIPMSLVNENGGIRRGFLTKASKVGILRAYNDAITAAAREAGTRQVEENWEGFLKKYREYRKIGPDKSDEYVVGHLLETTFADKNAATSTINFKVLLSKMGIRATELNVHAVNKFVEKLQPANTVANGFNAVVLELKDGDRIDRRNSSMSAVAELLGKPDLIARATDVRFTDKEGEVVEGTFMDFANGLDLGSGKKKYFQQIGDDPFNGSAEPGNFMKQIADLQVIDYLCGNLDRHYGNLFYKVDDNGRLIGVQGIDNDTSFGSNAPGEKDLQRLPGTANMGVISESMANKIKDMSPEMLRFTLRGRGLSEAQLDFAALRLEQLKAAIAKGKEHYGNKEIDNKQVYEEGFLRTVKDKDFAKLNIDQMCPEETDKAGWYKNLYGEVRSKMRVRTREARRNGAPFVPKEQRPAIKDELEKVDTADKTLSEKLTVQAMRESISGISTLVTFNTGKQKELGGAKNIDELTHGKNGSQKFADMVKAVKYLDSLHKYFKETLGNGKNAVNLQEYKRYYTQLKGAYQELADTQEAYLNFKMGEKKVTELKDLVGKNDYERNRIKFAKSVRQYVNHCKKKIDKLEDPESFAVDPEEVRAQAARQELEERKAAMEALKKLHEKEGLAAPETIKKAEKDGDQAALDSYQGKVKTRSEQIRKETEEQKKQQPKGIGL